MADDDYLLAPPKKAAPPKKPKGFGPAPKMPRDKPPKQAPAFRPGSTQPAVTQKAQGGGILDHSFRTPLGDAPVIPVALMAIGAYLAWFSIHYWASDTKWPTDPLKSLLTGKGIPAPDKSTFTDTLASISGAAATGSTAGSGSGSGDTVTGTLKTTGEGVAVDAMKYVGAGYVWGGNASSIGNWDCSSFVSYVLGHDLGKSLPGGGTWGGTGYPPNAHGPTTLDYMMFGTPVTQSAVQAGDLIVSSEHMGIAISSTQYVSARTPQLGVGVDYFPDGFPSGPPVYRRVTS